MTRILTAVSAGALALALAVGGPALAQEQTADAAIVGMEQLGMDTEGLVLTEEQVLEITAILNQSADDSERIAQINEVLGN